MRHFFFLPHSSSAMTLPSFYVILLHSVPSLLFFFFVHFSRVLLLLVILSYHYVIDFVVECLFICVLFFLYLFQSSARVHLATPRALEESYSMAEEIARKKRVS